MTAHHHLDDATILRFASGDLDEAFSVVVASHLAMCGACRNEAQAAEEIGGELLHTMEQENLSDGAFDQLMAKLDKSDATTVLDEKDTVGETLAGDVPLPLRRFIGPRLDDIDWRRVVPGVSQHKIVLPSSTSSKLYLLNIAPGKAMPEHGHGGAEMTLILSGAYRDELGRFGPGDIADLDEHVEHQPQVEPGEPCICLVATEAPTRFKDVISKLLQPFLGI